jgi:hypothetical protein
MRLTALLWGLELDVTFGLAVEQADEDEGAALNGGTLGAFPISFFGDYPAVEECPLPMRDNGWGDEE